MTNVDLLIKNCENSLKEKFSSLDEIALFNTQKVLNAFKKYKVSAAHFNFSTGYGYDDIGRDTLSKLYAEIFKTEKAVVSPLFASGTHTLSVALFALLMPGDELLSISGTPYDTLLETIKGKNIGSLADYGITYSEVGLKGADFDEEAILKAINDKTKVIFITRSRGYSWRDALTVDKIEKICAVLKAKYPQISIVVDNCYGEFTDYKEPTEVGADLVVGSLIKNIGGGLAPTGGYSAGKAELIEKIERRLTSPSIGGEVGSYFAGYLYMYEGLFLAPAHVKNALKGSSLVCAAFKSLGYEVMPDPLAKQGDIITSVKLNDKEKLLALIRQVQYNSPVDSYVTPEPWDMPGYDAQVAMAAGTFIQGASLELSCDSPIKEPYIAYMQGGLTYEHVKIALKNCLEEIEK